MKKAVNVFTRISGVLFAFASLAYAAVDDQALSAGRLQLTIPSQWNIMSEEELSAGKQQMEEAVKQMIQAYEQEEEQQQGFLGLEDFNSARMPDSGGIVVIYTMRIPPQENYIETMMAEQEQKIEWGKQQGLVKEVFSHEKRRLGDGEVVFVDTLMKGDMRSITMIYWSENDPGLVGSASLLIYPQYYAEAEDIVNQVVDSLTLK